jgi:hypothetical protein
LQVRVAAQANLIQLASIVKTAPFTQVNHAAHANCESFSGSRLFATYALLFGHFFVFGHV